jgi:uncharacterized protein with HEPN domain
MPQRDYAGYLWDIQNACQKILEFNTGKTLNDYLTDDATRFATERGLTIVGEALAQARVFFPEVLQDIGQVPQIVGFRNRLIHSYLSIDDTVVWQVVQQYIPVLLQEAQTALVRVGGLTE